MRTPVTSFKRLLLLILCLPALAACVQGEFYRECESGAQCPEGQICRFSNCILLREGRTDADAGGDADDDVTADTGDGCGAGGRMCGESCVDTTTTLATCGGCDGCAVLDAATATACEASQCVYSCGAGRVDANRDLGLADSDGCECDNTGPSTEVCDGVDNDCDGKTDADDPDYAAAGCDAQPNARLTGCAAGLCTYTCEGDFVDVDGDLGRGTNGCECDGGAGACGG